MSKAVLVDINCCKCGHPNKVLKVYSESFWGFEFGNYYLSLRNVRTYPMNNQMIVRECPECGYINPDLSEDNGLSMNFIKKLTTDGYEFKSEICTLFYKYYRMLMVLGRYIEAYKILTECLEECDYVGDTKGAMFCMMKMIKVYDMMEFHRDTHKMSHLDSLRRLGLFSQAKSFAHKVVFLDIYKTENDDTAPNVLKYQIYLANNYKDGLYTLKDMRAWLGEKDS